MAKNLKNVEVVIEDYRGVCLWLMPDGACIGDDEGRFLSMEGSLNDFIIEEKMKQAAIHYIGAEALEGKPFWMSGSRKITDSEADDHMERMLDGRIPDPVDVAKQLQRGGVL
jgi:hypothetical protein